MVREAIGSALPKPRKKPDRPRWKLKGAVEFIDAILPPQWSSFTPPLTPEPVLTKSNLEKRL
jgi:hypothetical protein